MRVHGIPRLQPRHARPYRTCAGCAPANQALETWLTPVARSLAGARSHRSPPTAPWSTHGRFRTSRTRARGRSSASSAACSAGTRVWSKCRPAVPPGSAASGEHGAFVHADHQPPTIAQHPPKLAQRRRQRLPQLHAVGGTHRVETTIGPRQRRRGAPAKIGLARQPGSTAACHAQHDRGGIDPASTAAGAARASNTRLTPGPNPMSRTCSPLTAATSAMTARTSGLLVTTIAIPAKRPISPDGHRNCCSNPTPTSWPWPRGPVQARRGAHLQPARQRHRAGRLEQDSGAGPSARPGT